MKTKGRRSWSAGKSSGKSESSVICDMVPENISVYSLNTDDESVVSMLTYEAVVPTTSYRSRSRRGRRRKRTFR